MINGYLPKFTLPSGVSDDRHGDGVAMIIDGTSMLIDGFEGGEPTNRMMTWLASKGVSDIDIAVLTHGHYDHYHGLELIERDKRFHIKTLYCYDPETLRHGVDNTSNGRAVKSDIANMYNFINYMKSQGTDVEYIDHDSKLKVGDINWNIYRKQPKTFGHLDGGEGYAFLNDGSLVLYSPEVRCIFGGDGPGALKDAIAYFNGVVIFYDVSHHGNSCPQSDAHALKLAGCILAWQSCIERNGVGTTGWTAYGSRRVKEEGITVWQQNEDVIFCAGGGKITFTQGSKAITAEIPYIGTTVEGWVENKKGRWYRYADGTWAIGWKLLKLDDTMRWFYFDYQGYAVKGWQYLKWSGGKSWFCFDTKTYAMLTGWQKCRWGGGKVNDFYFDERTGAMLTGWKYLVKDNKQGWYYLDDKTGAMMTEWVFVNKYWYYLDKDGLMLTGWIDYKNKRCYLEPDRAKNQGHAYRNQTAVIDGKTYRFDDGCYATEIKTTGEITSVSGKLNDIAASRRQFVIDIANYVRKYAPQYGIEVYSPIIAQAIHESGWGESKLSAKYHNYFGLKCGTKWTGKSVNMSTQEEYSAGTLTTISANFRVYDNMEEGVKGYFEFIQLARYSNLKGITSPRKYLETIIADGYATGKQYVDHVMNLINLYNLTQFDVAIAPVTPTEPKNTDANPIDMMIQIMDAELGYHEGANNHTKYGDEMHKIQPSNMNANAAWCFTANTMILTDCGYKPIEELKIGDLVLNASGNSFNRVTNIMSREHEVCSVKAYGSIDMKATPNHPFLSKKRLGVRKDGKYTSLDFRPVSSLKKGDDVVIPVTTMSFSEDLTYDEAWVIGYFVGDGWKTSRNDYKLCGNDNKEKLIYSHITSVRKDKNYKSRTCNEYTILADSNQRIIPFLDEAGKGAENKVVPKSILFSRKETKAAFIDGYLSADGDKDSRFSTVSKKLALGISKLAFDLGYGCALWYQVRAVDQKIYDERIGKYRDIKINPIIYVGKINKADKKQNRLDRIDGTNVYVPIKSLEITSETSTVYNISVNGDNTYLANNIAVHNCDAYFDWCILQLCKAFGYGADMAREVLCGDFDDYTYSSINLYKRQGRWFTSPQKGDQIFFGGAGHTGGVVDVKNGEVYTDEGNKSDQVMRCSYKIGDSRILGYGRPRYELLSGGLTAENMPLIKKGATGFAVVELQKRLNAASYNGKIVLTVDGDFGNNTYNALRAYQKDRGLEVDGECGKNSWQSLFNEV